MGHLLLERAMLSRGAPMVDRDRAPSFVLRRGKLERTAWRCA
jgi:hypothetical protein